MRFHDYADLLRFNADQVRDIAIVQAMHAEGTWPLLGPKAGGTEFQLGPAFYYLEYASGLVFGFTPVGTTLFIPIFSVLSIALSFLLFRKFFSVRVSLLLTLLSATSFFITKYSRFGWNPNLAPFFLLAFFLLLSRVTNHPVKRPHLSYALLGLVMGIGMQLHTFLLLSMPLLFLAVLGYQYKKTHQWPWRLFGVTSVVVVLLFSPVIYSEYQNQGANSQAFFRGMFLKTEAKATDQSPLLVTADFVLQGVSTILTGFEPRGQWVNPDAWRTAFNLENTLLLIFSLGITFGGAWCGLLKWRAGLATEERRLFLLLSGYSVAILLLFLIIGNELNLRFFTLLFFLPLLALGYILDRLERSAHPKLVLLLAGVGITLCVGVNTLAYAQTYDWEHPRSLTKAYGGISLGEAEGLARAIATTLEKDSTALPNLVLFEHERSLQYFLDTDGINLKTLKERSENPAGRFLILPRDARKSAFDHYQAFDIQSKGSVGRFELYWLEPQR